MTKNLNVILKKNIFSNSVINFPQSKSLTVLLGLTGSGKTTFLLECAAQWLKKDISVVYITSVGVHELIHKEVADLSLCTDIRLLKSLKSKYSDLIDVYSYDNLCEIDIEGKVLILDEFHLGVSTSLITKLANVAPHTFVSTQVYSEISEWVSDINASNTENLHFIIMQSDITDLHALPKLNYQQNNLENMVRVADWKIKNNSFRTFISLTQLQDQSRVHVHKFRLKGHSAF